MSSTKVKAKPKQSKAKPKKPKRPKGDKMVEMFHVEQKAKALSKQGLKPDSGSVSSGPDTMKHNTSEGIAKPEVEITLSRFHVEYDPAFCEDLIDHMAQGFSFESFAAALKPLAVEQNGQRIVLKRRTHAGTLYAWEKRHLDFAEAKKMGFEACRLFWETMGTVGAAGKMRGFNNITWLFNMKNRFRKEWKDRHEMNIKGSDNSGGLSQPKAVFLIPMNGREKPVEKDVTPKKDGEDDVN